MFVTDRYLEQITRYIDMAMISQEKNIERAAKLIAKYIEEDKLFYVYGPGGHSNVAAQDVFYRAGGLLHISPILDEGTLLSSGALRSKEMERTPGYATIVLDNYNVGANDLLIIVNASGINTAVIEAALEAEKRNATVIGISSHDHGRNTPNDHPARHESGKNLHEIVDIAIDSKVPLGDAVLTVTGLEQPMGAVSLFCNTFIMNMIGIHAASELAERGLEVPVLRSGNVEGGDAWNAQYFERFSGRVKHLQ